MRYTKWIARTGMTVGLLSLAMTTASAQADKREMSGKRVSRAHVEKMMSGWPAASREAVNFLTKKYGGPAAITPDMAVWGKTGPWKRTIVYGVEFPHEFPGHHTDVMQQWIDYKAPPEMYDELAMYDGSVVIERTSGEISARCDKEGANFLALNLANDIVTGKHTVESARKAYGEQIMAMKAKQPAPYTEKLLFEVRRGTNDPDQPLMNMGTSSRP